MGRPRKMPDGMIVRGQMYYAAFRSHGKYIRKKLSTDFEAACTILRDLRARADKQEFGLTDNAYEWSALRAEYLRWKNQVCRPGYYEADLKHFEKYQPVRL